MRISNLYNNKPVMQGKKIPLKDYKGPLLKLTPSDLERIKAYRENIALLTSEIYKIENALRTKISNQQYYYLSLQKDYYEKEIKVIERLILEIKMKRHQQQLLDEQKKQLR